MEDIEQVDDLSHARLTAAISKLDKTQHIKTPARGEPTSLIGEFDLVKNSRLDVLGLVSVLENSAKHVEIGKSLKKTQAPDKVLPKPLEKPQAERLKRTTIFESTRKQLGRWDATVARQRTVDHVSFPLKPLINKPKMDRSKHYLSKLKLKSDLEKELDEVEGQTEVLLDEEEEDKYPMTYEEMLEHRKELAKLRAQQSFKAAKAKRQNKIKSKKYHRILKKERMKQKLSEFESLQKTNPDEALQKLEELERTRAEERHTLRHKNTGKWAKSKLVQAKYNMEVRQQLADQLSVSRALTQKLQAQEQSSDDESDQREGIADIPVLQDPMNPWMLKKDGKSKEEEEFDFGYKKYIKENFECESSSNEDSDEEKGLDVTNFVAVSKRDIGIHDNGSIEMSKSANDIGDMKTDAEESKDCNKSEDGDDDVRELKSGFKPSSASSIFSTQTNIESTKPIATTKWTVVEEYVMKPQKEKIHRKTKVHDLEQQFDSLEDNISMKVTEKLNKLREDIDKITTKSKTRKRKVEEEDTLSKLQFKNQKMRPLVDTALDESADQNPSVNDWKTSAEKEKSLKDLVINSEKSGIGSSVNTANVDPTRFISAKPKYLSTALSKATDGLDSLDDEEQVVPKVNIEEVFEEDDVVASFRYEKEEEIKNDKVEDVDVSMPGWGNWGGKGVKPPRKKKSRIVFKAPPKLPRRDDNKGHIIIKEFKEPKLLSHKVAELPFPFTSLKDFEASIRAPLGNTFIPEIAHRKVIKPNVFTKAGAIIEPMDEDELLKQRNQSFKNESIIKLLGNK